MAKKLFKNKNLWKKIGIGAVAGLLGLGAIMGVGALLNKEEETTKVIKPAYEIGALAEDGTYIESKGSIYTKEAFECQGLDIDLDFRSNVSYRVFFYGEDNNFLSATEKLTKNYDENVTPLSSYYARIEITPNDDDKISWYEKSGYANQLTISVDKEQEKIELPYQGENKFVLNENISYATGGGIGEFNLDDGTWSGSGLISTDGCSKICITGDESVFKDVRIDFLTQDTYSGYAYLEGDGEEKFNVEFVKGRMFLITDVPTDVKGIVVYTQNEAVDMSSFAVYVW